MARVPFIAGNWKMHKTVPEAFALLRALKVKLADVEGVRVGVAPPATALRECKVALKETKILLGAQNMSHEEKGAFTGEIAPGMLKDCGCDFVILGHSERRTLYHETDLDVTRKAKTAHRTGLLPIVCVGETLAEREGGKTKDVVQTQIKGSLALLTPEEARATVIAYEPVWAIGTGKNATPADADEVHRWIRGFLDAQFGAGTGEAVVIQYGGSVKAENAKALLSEPNIDGALVGGASLDAEGFAAIVLAAAR